MHALRSTRKLLAGLGLAAFMIGFLPGSASALPDPTTFGKRATYKLFARALSYINVNRVYMGINTIGEVGVDSLGRGTVQGGYWPRGTGDNYIFNSGLQVAGVVAGVKSPTNPWGGDTTGGWFFDGAGGRQQTEAVTQAYQAFNSADAANWPADAFVPIGDSAASIYAQPLQGLVSASQGDVHFIAWEGNPAFNAVRLHPLGIMVDYRLLAWNYPAGAQDIVFLVGTIYNVTSANCTDYAAQRPALAAIACAQGQKFQLLNNAKFGITLPAGGYTITQAYMSVAGDNDVGNASNNYNGVNLPFAMGFTYDGAFEGSLAGWKFDPTIFTAPFFVGVGFVGYKYLKGPDGPGAIQLMNTFCNGGAVCGNGHSDPANMGVEYRLLAGQPYATDGQCNITSPGKTPAQIHVCFMLLGSVPADTRMLESSTEMTIAPGQAKTVVVAYVYAAPVQIPGFAASAAFHDPGNVILTSSTDSMFKYSASGSPGANQVDSLTGFLGYKGPHFNTDGTVHTPTQTEFSVVKGSLLGKALVAQAVFDAQFLQEFAPDAPQFFLIPGDKQVTVLWKPSDTETIGDPYFQIVKSPVETVNAQVIPNPLYDPNYRQFDVEGYRIYRGRSDSPSSLQLLVQYDYAGTKITDYTGFVLAGNCAPEIGVGTDCPVKFPTSTVPTPAGLGPAIPPGTAYTTSISYNIGVQAATLAPLQFVDQTAGVRLALAGGTTTITTVIDTVVSGTQDQISGSAANPPLADTGVPFIFIDKVGNCGNCGVNNGVNYFYSVTAFDVNAPGHGPTSLESARVTHQVTPQAPASNFNNSSTTQAGIFGRGGLLTDSILPSVDTTTGAFSKPFPHANGASLALAGFAPQLISGTGAVGMQYDSTTEVSLASAGAVGVVDWFTALSSGAPVVVQIPFSLGFNTSTTTGTANFTAVKVDSALATIYGGGPGYSLAAAFTDKRPDGYWTGAQGRGCANTVYGYTPTVANSCYFNGPRWFVGANETGAPGTVVPISIDNDAGGTGLPSATDPLPVSYNNGGVLPGVKVLHYPFGAGYLINAPRRDIDNSMSPFVSAADYHLYWGAGGTIDSVIDITHNEPVPFKPTVGASWGVLNSQPKTGGANRTEVTADDISCVAPLKNIATANPSEGAAGSGPALTPCATLIALTNTAVPGPIAFFNGALGNAASTTLAPTEPNKGFMLYLKGRTYIFELTGDALPAAGTVWTCRDLVGIAYGGNGPARQGGAWKYIAPPELPFNAPGIAVKFSFTVANQIVATDQTALSKVHTVPDPYYVTSAFDIAVDAKDIQFVNVPTKATIRIYTTSGVLVRVLQNTSTTFGGIVHWNVRNRTNQFVASGVYFYTVESGGISHTGRMTIVQYASTVQ